MLANYGAELRTGMLSEWPNGVGTGQNSGFQAINIAYLAGAHRVLLLGFDMQSRDGKAHWFGDHPIATQESWFSAFLQNFARLARFLPAGFEIINCTPGGALNCFPRMPLDEALARVVDDSAAAALPA